MNAGVRRVVRALANSVEHFLPERYRLPYEVTRLRLAHRLEEEIYLLGALAQRREVALDIGANRGYYTYHLARLFRRVEAFEPNPAVLGYLTAWRAPNVTVHTVALSSAAGVLELFIPIVNGAPQTGWASFDRQNLPEALEFQVIQVPVLPLDTYGLEAVSFIKMDVEGHEPAVLVGATKTIEAHRPVVLLEVKEKNRECVFSFFLQRGYGAYRVRGGRLVSMAEPPSPGEMPGENFVFRPE